MIKKRNRTQPPAKEPQRKGSLAKQASVSARSKPSSPNVHSNSASSIASGGAGAGVNPNASASTGGKKARRASDGPDRSGPEARGLSMSLGR